MTIELIDQGLNTTYSGPITFSNITIPSGSLLITVHKGSTRTTPAELDGAGITSVLEDRGLHGSLNEGRLCYAYNYAPGTYDLEMSTAYGGYTQHAAYALFSGVSESGGQLNTDTDSGNIAQATVAVPVLGLAVCAWMGHASAGGHNWDNEVYDSLWSAGDSRLAIGYNIAEDSGNITIGGTSNYAGAALAIGIGAAGSAGAQPVFF